MQSSTTFCYNNIIYIVNEFYIMKFTVTIFALCIGYVLAAPTLETCKCWDDYEAKADSDGVVMCHGIRVFALKPCNLPPAPRCVCEKDKVTGILTDSEGTFCSISEKGQLVKKWPCENTADWAKYKQEYAEFEKSLKQ